MAFMAETLLEMDHITKTFPGVLALDEVSLKVARGTVHALVGENGAGKSTLMKCLFGIYRQDAGEIRLDGHVVAVNAAKQALDLGISMIHQEPHPVRFRSVAENIWLGRFPQYFPGVVNH
ncbi:MAG: ATP-binding cassette domain-containing protein, partial [Propionibacteriaceae bacterium]|nr:ATP-binding cassette domain-containing protein [Propionibacteriaceae bacterium]